MAPKESIVTVLRSAFFDRHLAHPRLGKMPVPQSKMVLTETLRHKDLDRFSQKFLAPIAEQSLCLGIHQHDSSRLVDDDHRIGRRFQEPAEQRIIPGRGRIKPFHPRPHRGTLNLGPIPSLNVKPAVLPRNGM